MRVRLRQLPRREGDAILAGAGRPADGLSWAADYPAEDTVVALSMLGLAHEAAGVVRAEHPPWWLHQIVVGGIGQDLVVGDIGFHGPPPVDGPAAVEIGYHVVPDWRGRGIATRACALLLDLAWRQGADLVRAEAEPADSRAVLRRCGFRELSDHRFEVTRP